jgi:hypothetical protein
MPSDNSSNLGGAARTDDANEAKDAGSKKKAAPPPTTAPSTPPPPSNAGPGGNVQAAPVLSLLSPAFAPAGSPATTVALSGTGFSQGAMVDVKGQRIAPKGMSDDRNITIEIPATLLQTSGPLPITVVMGSVNSNSVTFTVSSAAAPTISTVTPSTTTARAGNGTQQPLAIQVNGANFTANSVVLFNGSPLPTQRVSASQLTANVDNTLLRTPGTVPISVKDGNNTSAPFQFSITADTTGTGTGTGTGTPCSSLGLQPGYCIASGENAGVYCDTNNVAYRDYTRCPYGAGAGTGYLTCADAGVTGYGCVGQGRYAGMLCSNGYLYQDATCNSLYGNGNGNGNACAVSCTTAGVRPSGCVSQGTYQGEFCAADGCVYDGTPYGCDVYRGGGGGGGGAVCAGASCFDYGVAQLQCVQTTYGVAQCATDGCMYLGCN